MIRMLFTFLLVLFVWRVQAASVRIGSRSIPLVFDESVDEVADTNRIAQELSAYFSASESVNELFVTNGIQEPGRARLKPLAPLCPSMTIAEDIRYVPGLDEHVMVGMETISHLHEAIAQASALSNGWSQAESLLTNLFSGEITNNLSSARMVFSADENPWPEQLPDGAFAEHVQSFWMQKQYYPPSLLTWRLYNDPQTGSKEPAVLLTFRDKDDSTAFLYKTMLFRHQGVWRVLIPAH